ncbi:MAG: NADH-quinone oxidoreductase subunit NuoK [Candidatus Kariarchaeaceae archaeon]|jgi:NADH-quinone oxidoreductase subunit K
MIPPENFLTLSAIMFTAGLFGVLTQRNAVRILISVEIMLNAANIGVMAFNGIFGTDNSQEGWVFVFIVIAIAAAEAAIGLAIFLSIYRNFGEITVTNIFSLSEQEVQ